MYDLASYHEVPRLCISEGAGIMSLSLADDNRHLLLNMTDQQIHLWQVNPDSAQPTSPGQGCGVLGLRFCCLDCTSCRHRESVGAVGASCTGLAVGWQRRGPSPVPVGPSKPAGRGCMQCPAQLGQSASSCVQAAPCPASPCCLAPMRTSSREGLHGMPQQCQKPGNHDVGVPTSCFRCLALQVAA